MLCWEPAAVPATLHRVPCWHPIPCSCLVPGAVVGQSLLHCSNTQRKCWGSGGASALGEGKDRSLHSLLHLLNDKVSHHQLTTEPCMGSRSPWVTTLCSPLAAESTGGFACHAARPAVSWEGSSWRAAVSPGLGTLLTQEPQRESYSHPGKRSETGARLCSLTPHALSVGVLLPSVLKSRSPHRSWRQCSSCTCFGVR